MRGIFISHLSRSRTDWQPARFHGTVCRYAVHALALAQAWSELSVSKGIRLTRTCRPRRRGPAMMTIRLRMYVSTETFRWGPGGCRVKLPPPLLFSVNFKQRVKDSYICSVK